MDAGLRSSCSLRRTTPSRWTTGLALVAGLAVWLGCRGPNDPQDFGTRAVVIGIDGADWKLIDTLAAEGRLPHLSRLRSEGVSGPIETLTDIALSPVIWTSIATGKTAAKHGITWFLVDQPDGTRVPVRSHNRKVKAIWNVLGEHGRRAAVVGWWASYPAEDVGKGVVVSDGLGFHGFGHTARAGDDRGKTYPERLFAELDPLVPTEQQVAYETVARFIDLDAAAYRQEMFDPGRFPQRDPDNPIHFFQQYAVTAEGYTAITERLLGERDDDLTMVYYEQVDSFSHLFMKYAPPPLAWTDPALAARYGRVVREWYVHQDELLGRLLAKIDLAETAVFVVSDHGFKSGERRIRSEQTVDAATAHLDHEPLGVFIAAGPHLRRGATVTGASVLDVTPTVLRYLGFPVAKDMDGKVLESVFEPAFVANHPLRYVNTYETPSAKPAATKSETTTAAAQTELEKKLAALGYLGGGGSGSRTGDSLATPPAGGTLGEASSPEMRNNLGNIHLRDGKVAEAKREFEAALAQDPKNADALLNLASIAAHEGKTSEAEHLIRRALAVDPTSVGALAQLAELERDNGNLPEAIRLFEAALASAGSAPWLHLGYGDVLQRAKRYAAAEKAFKRVLELDPDSFKARYNLGVTYAAQGKVDAAEAAYREALAADPDHPEVGMVYNNLGFQALAQRREAEAIDWFAKAVTAAPRSLEARYNLGVRRLEAGDVPAAIEQLEAAVALEPTHELANQQLGIAYLEANRAADAQRVFTLLRRLYPRNWVAPLGLAVVHAAVGNQNEAQQELRAALTLGGQQARNRAGAYPVLAETLSALGP